MSLLGRTPTRSALLLFYLSWHPIAELIEAGFNCGFRMMR
jgi:hypothetical protein